MPESLVHRSIDGPSGAVVLSDALIANRFSARFVDVTGQTRALANLAGMKRARQRGRGVEFDEVRAYAAGDDVRAIDWRVTARSGTAHTKLFHEDREQPILVAIDQRTPMKFGSTQCFKSVMAAHVGTLALWSALGAGERVGGVVLGDNSLSDTRPKRSQHSVLRVIGDLVREGAPNAADNAPSNDLSHLLQQLERIARPGTRVFLISYFHDLLEADNFSPLRRLARRTQLVGIAVNDRLEAELPRSGHYAVTDGNHHSSLDTGADTIREAYANQYRSNQELTARRLRELRIPLLRISTGDDPLRRLLTVFPAR